MKIYLAKTNGNNFVVFTDGETGQVFDGAPAGMYYGIDLYAEDADMKLAQMFADDGVLTDYEEIHSCITVLWRDLENDVRIKLIRVY